MMTQSSRVAVHDGDLPEAVVRRLATDQVVALDTETTGLDWRQDRVLLCQVADLGGDIQLVRIGGKRPEGLLALLSTPTLVKVFHHAMFDLRFMAHHWGARPANVACTKIASKILGPEGRHTLKDLLQVHLGIDVDKTERLSDWSAAELSRSQIEYAATDVAHLIELLSVLRAKTQRAGLADMLCGCFAHIPTRVQLDIRGYPDVFTY